MNIKKFIIGLSIFFIVGLIGVVALVASIKSYEPNKEIATNDPIVITAYNLSKAYTDNEVKANQDYKDKVVTVNGTVGDIGGDDVAAIFTIGGDNSTYIQCEVRDKEQIKKVTELKKNNGVNVTGTVTGIHKGIILINNCEIN